MVALLPNAERLLSEEKESMYNTADVLTKYSDLIYNRAHKFSRENPRFDFEDLVEEGKVAALNAAKSFDANRNTSFITYLTTTIDNELRKFVWSNEYDVYVSEHHRRTHHETLKTDTKTVRLDFDYESSMGDDGLLSKNGPHQLIPSGVPAPEDILMKEESISILREELSNLPDRERNILELRFLEDKTLQEIADSLKVPKQTIYAWQKKGMAILSKRVKNRLGSDYFD